MHRLAAVILCLSVLAAISAAVRPASAFEVQSGGIPLSAAAVSMLANSTLTNRAGAAQPTGSGAGGAFPPWMGGGRSEAVGGGLPGMKGVGLPPPGRAAVSAVPDRAAMNEQLFGIRR